MAGAVKLPAAQCEHDGCGRASSFKFEGEEGFRFCDQHKLAGMVQPRKKCEHPSCRRTPNFNLPGQKEGIVCKLHMKEGMTKVVVGGAAPKKAKQNTKAVKATTAETERQGAAEVRRGAMEAAKERAAVRAAALSAAMNSKGSPVSM